PRRGSRSSTAPPDRGGLRTGGAGRSSPRSRGMMPPPPRGGRGGKSRRAALDSIRRRIPAGSGGRRQVGAFEDGPAESHRVARVDHAIVITVRRIEVDDADRGPADVEGDHDRIGDVEYIVTIDIAADEGRPGILIGEQA